MNARKNKNHVDANTTSTQKLKEKLDKMHQQIIDLEYLINGHFAGVFKRRHRDRVGFIRRICVDFLCEWMLNYSSVFVSDHYLKYVGWALSDKEAECRVSGIKCLLRLCSVANLLPHLENFFDFYKKRLLKLPNDIDINVASSSIHLLAKLAE